MTLEKPRQEDLKFHANQGCIVRSHLKQTNKTKQTQTSQLLSQVSDPVHEKMDRYPGQIQPVVAMGNSAWELEDQGRLPGGV